jgi:O-antigen/teichoic acid export membrane protein
MKSLRRPGSIAYNSALNLIGFTVPMIVGLLAVPVITRELGAARFGLLSLAFAILEYSSLFDLGLGAATTREVSAAIARRDEGLSTLIAGSVTSQAILGSVGAVVLVLLSGPLVDRIFDSPADLRGEALAVFRMLALMIPATVVLLSLRGILEAAGRFDLSNGIRIPTSVATFLVPAVAASYGYGLPVIVAMLLVTRVLICAVMAAAITNILPGHRWRLSIGWSAMRPLFVFGGWMSLSNILSPVLVYIDRFMLAAIAGVAAVGYYTAPFDAVMRLLIIPASLMGAVYPSVSGKLAMKDYRGIDAVYAEAIRKTLILLIVPGLVIGIFGPWLLERWLGPAFASEALLAVRILAVGVFFHAMARIPSGFINALGRPDLVAKLNLAEVLVHIPVAWALISRFGLTGAALAWTVRVTLDAVLLYIVSAGVLRRLDRTGVGAGAPA